MIFLDPTKDMLDRDDEYVAAEMNFWNGFSFGMTNQNKLKHAEVREIYEKLRTEYLKRKGAL